MGSFWELKNMGRREEAEVGREGMFGMISRNTDGAD